MNGRSRDTAYRVVRLIYRYIGDAGRRRLGNVPMIRRTFFRIARLIDGNHGEFICVELAGHMMYVPFDFYGFSLLGEYEPETTRIFADSLGEGDVIVDVGAHVGYYSLLGARKVGRMGHVFCFEPVPQNFHLLVRNIELNGYRNITAMCKAVSSSKGRARLYFRGSLTGGLIRAEATPEEGAVGTCDTLTLDDFFADKPSWTPRISLIKMDIEGGEPQALEGMSRLIKSARHLTLITEFNPTFIRWAGSSPSQFLRRLEDLGFKVTAAADGNEVNPTQLTETIPPGSGVNLVCRKVA